MAFDLDFNALEKEFEDLTKLAARVAGTEISLLNLIDIYTQWTVAGHGFRLNQTPRENSICQFTILETDHFEVKDMQDDARFRHLAYEKDGKPLRYYFGVPLRTPDGYSVGALCVIGTATINLSSEKIDIIKSLANEIVNRLVLLQELRTVRGELAESRAVNKRVAHDIRAPLGGIIGLAKVLLDNESSKVPGNVLKMVQMIYKSGQSLLGLADEIMAVPEPKKQPETSASELSLTTFREKLLQLYAPQAAEKGIAFSVEINKEVANITFAKSQLMQLAGNLISNAIKFTPPLGAVSVYLLLTLSQDHRVLLIRVSDTGIGLSEKQVAAIRGGQSASTSGTRGELGYGMGLQLVKQLLENLHGNMQVEATEGKGTSFEIRIPIGTVTHRA